MNESVCECWGGMRTYFSFVHFLKSLHRNSECVFVKVQSRGWLWDEHNSAALHVGSQRALTADKSTPHHIVLACSPAFTAHCLLTVLPVITRIGILCNFTLAYTHAIINSAK